MKITSEVVNIDEAFARNALGNAAPNRAVSRVTVNAYAREMLCGFWTLNGEPIVFDADGKLAEGQHRMHAVLVACRERAGFCVQCLVVRGVPCGSRFNMGRTRTIADQYRIDGGKDAAFTTSLARAVLLWSDETGIRHSDYSTKTTYDEIADLLSSDEHILAAAAAPSADHIIARRALRFLRWLFARVPGANDWFDTVINGADLSETCPAFVLRNFLIRNQQKKNSVSSTFFVSQFMVPVAVTIKAWNAHVQHRKIEGLRYNIEEKFPIPYGLLPRRK